MNQDEFSNLLIEYCLLMWLVTTVIKFKRIVEKNVQPF